VKADVRTALLTVGLIVFGGLLGFLITLLALGRH